VFECYVSSVIRIYDIYLFRDLGIAMKLNQCGNAMSGQGTYGIFPPGSVLFAQMTCQYTYTVLEDAGKVAAFRLTSTFMGNEGCLPGN